MRSRGWLAGWTGLEELPANLIFTYITVTGGGPKEMAEKSGVRRVEGQDFKGETGAGRGSERNPSIHNDSFRHRERKGT